MPKLTDEEIDLLLTREALIRVATVSEDGFPLVVPVGFIFQDRRILLTARARNKWLANIRRDPRVCACVEEHFYPGRRVTITGRAEIIFEPGQDDEWRDVRLPLVDPSKLPDDDSPSAEWTFESAYHLITRDEPRALVSIHLDGSAVTSWRSPVEGEYLDASWARRYYEHPTRRFRVVATGRGFSDVRVVAE